MPTSAAPSPRSIVCVLGRLDARAGDPGVQVGLADAADAFVGVHLDDDGVLVGAGRIGQIAGVEQHVALDAA